MVLFTALVVQTKSGESFGRTFHRLSYAISKNILKCQEANFSVLMKFDISLFCGKVKRLVESTKYLKL